MQRNILEYLEKTVLRVPEKVAFSSEDNALTFRQVSDQAQAIGSELLRMGLHRQPVAVFMRKQPKTIAAFLGVVYSGCFYVPLDEDMPRYRLERILEQLGPAACICDDATFPVAQALTGIGRLCQYDQIAAEQIDGDALKRVRAHQIDTDPIYTVFTSGSTGVPKGVVGCHRAVIDYIENLCDVLKFDEQTIFGNQTPLYFDACLKEIMPTLKYGATTHLIPRKLFLLPVKLVEYLNAEKINTLCWVVSALTYISAFRTLECVVPRYVKTIAFASEVFPIRQLNLWRAALPNARFFNLYGPTETTGICCYYQVTGELSEEEPLPIGQPFPNTDVFLLNESGQECADGETGEICIRGTRLTPGYFRKAEKTGQCFVQNPLNPDYPEIIYRTGDLGQFDRQGQLVFLGRRDQQVKHMGHRIELGEIENAANRLSGICASCCIFDPDQKKILLFYTGDISAEALKQHLKNQLPRYMLPHGIHQLHRMPTTPNGKIDRNLLQKRSHNNG